MANTTRSETGDAKAKTQKRSTRTAATAPSVKSAPSDPVIDEADEYDDLEALDDLYEMSEAEELEALNELEEEAEAAALAAADAKATFIARRTAAAQRAAELRSEQRAAQRDAQGDAHGAGQRNTRQDEPAPRRGAGRGGSGGGQGRSRFGGIGDPENYLGMLTNVLDDMNGDDWDAEKFDDMSQGVNLVLGSGPAFAALGSMLANSTAQSSILMNATQMQRQLDQVGLCCTSACVQQLLNLNNGRDTD